MPATPAGNTAPGDATTPPAPVGPAAVGARPSVFSRRGFLGAAAVSTSAAVLATGGVAIPLLRRVSVLGWSSGTGPQHLPVNRTAVAAGVTTALADPGYLLQIGWRGGESRLSLTDLRALPQTTAELPIACVEGWSRSATWTGVRLRDLLRHAGAPADSPVRVESLEQVGGYRASTLPAAHVADPLTLLALHLNGEVLSPDHGYPCRIIAPSRPGVLQTKWVVRLQVLS
jgi:DMSO/TMAO reductase YedYZ molybdopterin-dependent catalytic subunit